MGLDAVDRETAGDVPLGLADRISVYCSSVRAIGFQRGLQTLHRELSSFRGPTLTNLGRPRNRVTG